MRKALAVVAGVAGAGVGISAFTKSDWFTRNAPALSCQICRAFIWNVWPKHWGGEVEMRPGHGPHVIAA
ncbi:MAG: hypothetical protein HKO82_00450 [Acidimicrobiia bacterium]|nr:hypothetical protein [Acidimicrobiia bacterium]NNL12140.1 hypothetical protein [Acidimicrobiia bacterium]